MKNYRLLNLLFIFIATLLFGCSNKMKAQSSNVDIAQGIQGKVVWLEGNMMPSISDTGNVPQQKGEPVKREVHIYALTNSSEANAKQGFYNSLPTEFIKKIETDENGNFAVELEPGKYSVFVKEAKGLWANIFDGEGNIMPVEVSEGEVTPLKIEVNYKAAY